MNLIKNNLSKIVVSLCVVASILVGPAFFSLINAYIGESEVIILTGIVFRVVPAMALIILAYNKELNTNKLTFPVAIFYGYLVAINIYNAIYTNSFELLFFILFYAITAIINIYYIIGNSKLKNIANLLVLASFAISFVQIFGNYLALSNLLIETAILVSTYLLESKKVQTNNIEEEESKHEKNN